jgi:hypothetical protein
MCVYIFIYRFDSTELILSMDRGLYELCIDSNTNTAALLIVFNIDLNGIVRILITVDDLWYH